MDSNRSGWRRLAAGILTALVMLLGAARARTDEVVLTGGTRLQGVVLERSDQSLRLLLPEGVEVSLAAADVASVVPDATAPKAGEFLRFHDRGKEGGSLQVAAVYLVPEKGPGPRVALVGVVHVADRAFYREVQAGLERAEVVLYEMVKPADKSVAEVEAQPNPLRDFQSRMGKALGLVFQLDEIAYDRPHFVHADVETLGADEEALKDALPENVKRMLPLLGLVNGFLDQLIKSSSPESRAQLRKTVAKMMGTMGPKAASLLGAEASEMLIDRRNAVVVERLKTLPPGTKTVAILYGAAHLPDLEERIAGELGYRRAGARWMDAWRIGGEAPEGG